MAVSNASTIVVKSIAFSRSICRSASMSTFIWPPSPSRGARLWTARWLPLPGQHDLGVLDLLERDGDLVAVHVELYLRVVRPEDDADDLGGRRLRAVPR